MTDVELPLMSFVQTREGIENLVKDADDLCFRGHRANGTEDIVGDLRRKDGLVSDSYATLELSRRNERRTNLSE